MEPTTALHLIVQLIDGRHAAATALGVVTADYSCASTPPSKPTVAMG
jgi:hypothetical protein